MYTYNIRVEDKEFLNYTTFSVYEASGKLAQYRREGHDAKLIKRDSDTGKTVQIWADKHGVLEV